VAARKAKENGSTRFCMGAAWRDLSGRKRGFERILEMVREIRKMDMEVCTTLGMLSPTQAKQLKEAYVSHHPRRPYDLLSDASASTRGLTAYNHNLDTSREHYPKVGLPRAILDARRLIPSSAQVITTRTYDDRLDTISHVREAGISVCSGGILGLGESDDDRVGLIWEASKCVPCSSWRVQHILLLEVHSMPEHPESFPVNALVPIKGTPLEDNEVGIPSVASTFETRP